MALTPRLADATRSRARDRPPRRAGHPRRLRGLLPVPLRARQRHHGPVRAVRGGRDGRAVADPGQPGGSAPARCWPCCRWAGSWSRWARCCRSPRRRPSRACSCSGSPCLRGDRRPAPRRARHRHPAAVHPPVLPAVRPRLAVAPAGRAHARGAAARRGRGHAVARRHADAVPHEARPTPSARSPAAWTPWPTCGRGGPRAGSGSRRALPAATDAAEALRPSRLPPGLRPASAGRRDRALAVGRGLGPAAAGPHGRPLARRRPLRRHAPARPPPSCARRPRAPTRRRPGCAGRPRRCPTPTGSRPRSTSSGPPATPRRPTACHPSGCSSDRWR